MGGLGQNLRPSKMKSVISFRVPQEIDLLLANKAAEFGLSPGECARTLVIEALTNEFPNHVLTLLDRILRTIQAARNDTETATLGLLITAGQQSLEEAQEWLQNNLRIDV